MAETQTAQKTIILSADSTCDLDEELKERYHVHYFPLHINLDGKDYLDNVDITPEQIYQEYYDHKILPKTSAVNVQEYIDHFRPWVESGYEVIHINLGHALSSSYQNCCLAAEELGHVHVVDSCNLSTGTGLTVVAAGRLIEEAMQALETTAEEGTTFAGSDVPSAHSRETIGQFAEEIAEKLRAGTSRRHGSFTLDTLTFLSAGGRCSAVAAFGANMLRIKPCIQVDNRDGSMTVGRKYRGALDKVLARYVKDELAKYPNIDTGLLFITPSGIPREYIDLVRKTAEEALPFREIHITKASCTISCHCGPNTLGILFETKS